MKNFVRLSLCAMVVLMVALIMAAAVVPASAASGRTIYIAEVATGKGDGSSPDNLMGSEEIIAPSNPTATTNWQKYDSGKYYQNSALYRAAQELASTGGKIVLVGDVSIDFTKTNAGNRQDTRDFEMPTHGNNEITITNENYSGKLILTEGAMITLGGRTVFEDIIFATHDGTATADNAKKYYAICCNGYKTVFGNNITCVSYSGDLNSSSHPVRSQNAANKDYFITIAGGERWRNIERSCDVTVKSGTWCNVIGSNLGNSGYKQYGDVNVRLEGGTFLGAINGAGSYTTTVCTYGDAKVEILGGKYYGNIYAAGRTRQGYDNNKVDIIVKGGNFLNSNVIKERVSGSHKVNLTVDLSACTSNDTQAAKLTSVLTEGTVIYPAGMITSATVKSYNKIAFKGEEYDSNGFTLSVTYSNGKTANVVCDSENKKFNFVLDTSKTGAAVMKWTYGPVSGTCDVTVLNIPAPKFEGAQVGVDSSNLGKLRLVASMSIELTNGVSLVENGAEKPYGFIAIVNTPVTDKMELDLVNTGNAIKLAGEVFRKDVDVSGMYNSTVKRTVSAELTGLSLKDYATNVSVVAYVKFMYNGEEYVRYSSVANKSVLGVANAAYASAIESGEDKAFIKTNIIDKYAAYTANKNVMYDSSSADAMRAEVVNAFKAMASYPWTPSETFSLTTGTGTNAKTNTYTEGTTYYGIPYINNRKATLNEFTSNITTVSGTKGKTNLYTGLVRGIYDIMGTPTYDADGNFVSLSSGVYTNASVINSYKAKLESGSKVTDYVDEKLLTVSDFFPAVDYSAIYNAWNVVSTNDVWPVGLSGAIPTASNGLVAVGGYTYSGTDTKAICESNGTAVMYAAYAACKPGDVLVNYSSSGRSLHIVTTASNGTAAASTTLKRSYTTDTIQSNKSHFVIDSTTSFQNLYNSGFIPVTIPELANGLKTPTTAILTGFDGEKTFETGKVVGVVDSNRTIISLTVEMGQKGNNIYDETHYYTTKDMDMNRVDLSEFSFEHIINYNSSGLNYLNAGETYDIKITAEIGGESKPVVLKEDSYTVPEKNLDKFAKVFTAANTSFLATPSNLQNGAIDHMWEQFNEKVWTPSHSFQYFDTNTESDAFCPTSIYKAGTKYKGVLYSNMRATLEEFNKTLTTNNVLNIDTSLTIKNGYYQMDWSKIMGNHCSAAMFHSYQQSSRLSAGYGSRENPDMKCVGVDDVFSRFAKYITGATASVTEAYGNYAMYESYAQWQKGDYMYNTAGGGHTRMVTEVKVVRDSATGKIDPHNSYVLLCEQVDALISRRIDSNGYYLYVGTTESGTTFMQFIKPSDTTTVRPTNAKVYKTFAAFYADYGFDTTWWLNNKYSFYQLADINAGSDYNAVGYRPLEYITNTAEDTYVGLNREISLEDLRNTKVAIPAIVESNYPIVSVFARITAANGTVTEAYGFRAQTNVYKYDFSSKINSSTPSLAETLNTALDGLAKGTYKVSVYAELAKGEVELINYNFTK